MKRSYCLLSGMLLAMLIAVVGCGGGEGGGEPAASVDTSGLEASMASADPEAKGASDKAVASINSQDYTGAMASLNSLAGNAKLTDEQKTAVTDLIAQVKKQIEAAASKAVEEGQKAAEEGKKALEGLTPKTQ